MFGFSPGRRVLGASRTQRLLGHWHRLLALGALAGPCGPGFHVHLRQAPARDMTGTDRVPARGASSSGLLQLVSHRRKGTGGQEGEGQLVSPQWLLVHTQCLAGAPWATRSRHLAAKRHLGRGRRHRTNTQQGLSTWTSGTPGKPSLLVGLDLPPGVRLSVLGNCTASRWFQHAPKVTAFGQGPRPGGGDMGRGCVSAVREDGGLRLRTVTSKAGPLLRWTPRLLL